MADKRRRKESLSKEKILEEILVRLPVDDLTRYKAVCKGWCSLISSPDFVSERLKRFKPDLSIHRILLLDEYFPPDGVELPGPFRSVIRCLSLSVIIVGSINGLICMVGNFGRYGESPDDIRILNPVTRYSIKLPSPTTPFNGKSDRVTFAFWWDSSSGDYKVVKIISRLGRWDHLAEVWVNNSSNSNYPICAEEWVSSSPDKWTDIPINLIRPFYHRYYDYVTVCDIIVGGVAYWIVIEKHNKGKFVLSLDMATLEWKQIPLPALSIHPSFLIGSNNVSFFAAEWKGVFALVERNEANNMHTVWTENDSYQGDWSIRTSFHLDFLSPIFLNFIHGKLAIKIVRDQVKWVNGNFTQKMGKNHIALFDMETQTFETQSFEDLEDLGYTSAVSVHDFVGSFESIKGFKPVSETEIGRLLTVIWPDPGEIRNSNEGFKIHMKEEAVDKGKQLKAREDVCCLWVGYESPLGCS